jgi:hypothetical protein
MSAQPSDVKPFRVEGSGAGLEDLRDRLVWARFPGQLPTQPWEQGTDLTYLRELVAYWRDEYDRRAQESRINAVPQFLTAIDGQRI